MRVIILAAGYAVRLQPLTTDTPKSLLPVGGRIILDRILDKVFSVPGVGSACIVTNAKFFRKFEAWRLPSRHRDRTAVIDDGTTSNENRLGAIKDIELALGQTGIDDDVLIIAGDNLFDFDMNRFMAFARAHADGVSIALYDVRDRFLASNYGVVKIDTSSRVVDFQEKPPAPESTLASTGIYYFPKNKLPFIKEYVKMQSKLAHSTLRPCSGSNPELLSKDSTGSGPTPSSYRGVDAPGYYIGWLCKRDVVYGFTFTEDWYDIGSIDSYHKADREYLLKERKDNG